MAGIKGRVSVTRRVCRILSAGAVAPDDATNHV